MQNNINHNHSRHHRNQRSLKYVTPRKTAIKHKKICIQMPDLHLTQHDENYNYNYTNSHSKSKSKQNSKHKYHNQVPPLYNNNHNIYHDTHQQYPLSPASTTLTHTPKQKQWKITDFQILKQMGRGKFGYVYAAKEKQTDYLVAIKKMSKQELRDHDFQQQVKRQIIIQASINHRNVLRLFGYFWDIQNVYLILEYAPDGELFNILQKSKIFPQDQVSVIIRQVCLGLQYLHSHSIIHRDIKPENILVSGQVLKIGDFGWSIQSYTRRQTLCGTLDYLAPEIVQGLTHDSSIDIWQVGVLAYELAVGSPPFQTPTSQQTYHKIINAQVKFPNNISYDLRNFIRKVLQKDPNKRMSCTQILKQQFITKYQNVGLDLKNI